MDKTRTDENVENDAETPDVVRERLVRNSLQDFRCRVRRTAAVRPTQLVGRLMPGKPEVGKFDVVFDIEQHVLALEVPVHATPSTTRMLATAVTGWLHVIRLNGQVPNIK